MTATILGLLAPYWQAIIGGIAMLVAGFGIYAKGKSVERQKAKLEDVTNANEIRRDGAAARAGSDPDKLHNDGWRRD